MSIFKEKVKEYKKIHYKVSDDKSGTLFFCPNGLLLSVQVWIMLDSHVKIIEIKVR